VGVGWGGVMGRGAGIGWKVVSCYHLTCDNNCQGHACARCTVNTCFTGPLHSQHKCDVLVYTCKWTSSLQAAI